jgi:hypothetical protein
VTRLAFLTASAALATAAVPSAASAAPIINFNGTSGIFGNTGLPAGDFSDEYRFQVASDGLLGAVITSISVSPLTDVTFTSVLLNNVPFTPVIAGSSEFRAREALAVTSGQQSLTVNGNSGGNSVYAGTLAFVAQQVPEPGTLATMAVALGFLGGGLSLSRSRKRSEETKEKA